MAVMPGIIAMLENNILSKRYLKELIQVKPMGAVVYKTYSKVGLLAGNGNHCDFLYLIFLSSKWDKNEIKNFYKCTQNGADVYFLNDDKEIFLNDLSHYHIDNMLLDINNTIEKIEQKISEEHSEQKIYYVLKLFHSMSYNGDWRCM